MTTAVTLQTKQQAQLVFSLCMEGLGYIWTNGDTALMLTAYAAATDFSSPDDIIGGLEILGQMGGKITPFDPSVDADHIEFRLREVRLGTRAVPLAGYLGKTFMRAGHATTNITFLNSNVGCTGNLSVADGSVLTAATSDAYIGHERFTYTARPATQPATLTANPRGKFAIHQAAGGARFAPPHRISADTAFRPPVSNNPRTDHYNRGVILRAHWVDPQTGAYDTVANALTIWVGRVKSHRWEGDGTVTVSCAGAQELLSEGTLFGDQYTAKVRRGVTFAGGLKRIGFLQNTTLNPKEYDYATMVAVATPCSDADDLSEAIRVAIAGLGAALRQSNYYVGRTADGFIKIGLETTGLGSDGGAYFYVGLNALVWDWLGFDGGTGYTTTDGTGTEADGTPYIITWKELKLTSANRYEAVAESLPLEYWFGTYDGIAISLQDVKGTWNNQPTLPTFSPGLPPGTNGFLQVGDLGVFAVRYDSATQVTKLANVTKHFATAGFTDAEGGETYKLREGDTNGLPVKQLWYERDFASNVLLRFLLSTGTSAFNDATYDVNPWGLGLAIPQSLLNKGSFAALNAEMVSYVLDKPVKFINFFESVLSTAGLYCVMMDGQITLRSINFTGSGITAAITFTESDKVAPVGSRDDPQRMVVEYSSDGLINRVTLNFSRAIDGSFRKSITVEDAGSISDFNARKKLEINGYSVEGEAEAAAWIDAVAAKVLAFWSRPLAMTQHTFSFQEIGNGIAAGDTCLITDSGMVNPATGLQGVTSLPGLITGWSFDWKTGIGVADIVLMPEVKADRIGPWAPSARVTSSSVAGGKLTVTCAANQYSLTGNDASYFPATAKCRIVEFSPANPAAPGNYSVTVDSQSGNDITFTTNPVPGALDTAKTWNVQFGNVGVPPTNAQLAYDFVADDATNSTGLATNDAYLMGDVPDPPATLPTIAYTTRFARTADVADDTGEPFSVAAYADAVRSLNCLLSSVTQNHAVAEYLETNLAQTDGAGVVYRIALVQWIPLYSDTRTFSVQPHCYHSVGTSSAKVRISFAWGLPLGTAITSSAGAVFSGVSTSLSFSTASTTPIWLTAQTVTPWPISSGGLPPGMWMTVELANGAAATTAYLLGVSLREDAAT